MWIVGKGEKCLKAKFEIMVKVINGRKTKEMKIKSTLSCISNVKS